MFINYIMLDFRNYYAILIIKPVAFPLLLQFDSFFKNIIISNIYI